MKTRPFGCINIGNTHNNNNGEAYRKKGHDHQALKFYNLAVSNFTKTNGENHPDMPMFNNNIDIIYQEKKEYRKALTFYEKSLGIWERHLPAGHPDLDRL